jgi:hypothetical protein
MLPAEIIEKIFYAVERIDLLAGFRLAEVCAWSWQVFGAKSQNKRLSIRGKHLRAIIQNIGMVDWAAISCNDSLPEQFFDRWHMYLVPDCISANSAIGLDFLRRWPLLYRFDSACKNARVARESMGWFDHNISTLAWTNICQNEGVGAEWLCAHANLWRGSVDCRQLVSARSDMLSWLASNPVLAIWPVVARECNDTQWILNNLRYVWTPELFDNPAAWPIIDYIASEPIFRRRIGRCLVPYTLRGESTWTWRETIPHGYFTNWIDWAQNADLNVPRTRAILLKTLQQGEADLVEELVDLCLFDLATMAHSVSMNPDAIDLLKRRPELVDKVAICHNAAAGELIDWFGPNVDMAAIAALKPV